MLQLFNPSSGSGAINVLTSLSINPLQIPAGSDGTPGIGFAGNGLGFFATTMKRVGGTTNDAVGFTPLTNAIHDHWLISDEGCMLWTPLDTNGDVRSWGGDGNGGNPIMVQTLGNSSGTAQSGVISYSAWNPSPGNGAATEPMILALKSRGAAIGLHGAVQFGDSLWQMQWCGDDGSSDFNDYASILAGSYNILCGDTVYTGNVPGQHNFNVVPSLQQGIVSTIITASIDNGSGSAGTVLTVTAIGGSPPGTVNNGMVVLGEGVTNNTTISGYTSGTGGSGTYVASQSQLVASSTLWLMGGGSPVLNTSKVIFHGSVSGTTLTVDAIVSGTFAAGWGIAGPTVTLGTYIISQLTGSAGSTGTYLLSESQTVASGSLAAFARGNSAITPALEITSDLGLAAFGNVQFLGKTLKLTTGYRYTGGGPFTITWENGTSPQGPANASLGTINYHAFNSAGSGISFIQEFYRMTNSTSTTETGEYWLSAYLSGALTVVAKFGGAGGMQVGAPTGTFKGTGTVNAQTAYYVNGAKFTATGGGDITFTNGGSAATAAVPSGTSTLVTTLSTGNTFVTFAGAGNTLLENSVAPAGATGNINTLTFRGRNDTPATKDFASITGSIATKTTGAEDGKILFATLVAGSNTTEMTIGGAVHGVALGTAVPMGTATFTLPPVTAPSSPASNAWVLYVDSGDSNKLKAKASTGTTVTLGTP